MACYTIKVHRLTALLATLTAAGAPAVVRAEPPERDRAEPGTGGLEAPTSNRVNMRIGGASTDTTARPTICIDVRVVARLGVEGCGTGQGVIHDETGSEMAHFRATWTVLERITPNGAGRLRAGAGFAELQVGVDHPGFRFGDPDGIDRGSVAGPEAAFQGQWLVPLGVGVEAILSATAGLAMFQSADKLVVPKSNVQPFASFEIGVGW